jgi:hypothetical protein
MMPLPPPDENGWERISRARARFTGVDLGPFASATDAALRPDATLESARAELERPRADFDGDPVAPIFRVCAEALQEPFFADATPLAFGEVAPVMPLLRCHQLAAYAVLLHAADSDWAAASDGAEILVRRAIEQVAPARTLLGYVGAMNNTKTALGVAAQLERWEPGACTSGLVASVEAITPEGISPAHALKGEYVLALGGIDLVLGTTPGAAPPTRLPAFAFDPGATQRALDESFIQMEAGQIPPLAQRGLWWWENGTGKLYLDAIPTRSCSASTTTTPTRPATSAWVRPTSLAGRDARHGLRGQGRLAHVPRRRRAGLPAAPAPRVRDRDARARGLIDHSDSLGRDGALRRRRRAVADRGRRHRPRRDVPARRPATGPTRRALPDLAEPTRRRQAGRPALLDALERDHAAGHRVEVVADQALSLENGSADSELLVLGAGQSASPSRARAPSS